MLQKHVTGTIKDRTAALSIPERHQLKVARQSMRMHCTGCLIMGGPNHRQAASIIHQLTSAIVGIDPDCTCKE